VQGVAAPVTLTAEFAGFQTSTITVAASPGAVTQVPLIQMRPGCVDIDLAVVPGLAAEAQTADAIVHLRVNALGTRRGWDVQNACLVAQDVDATVLADSRNRLVGQRLSVLVPPDRPRLSPRGEFVAFLKWDANAQRYTSFVHNLPVMQGSVAIPETDALHAAGATMRVRALFDRLTDTGRR
jgi:hypothetical protein